MSQLETLQDIYARLAEVKEVICGYCDYCAISIVDFPQLILQTDSTLAIAGSLQSDPPVGLSAVISESLEALANYLNSYTTSQFRLKFFDFYQNLVYPLNSVLVFREESSLLGYLTAIQALWAFVLTYGPKLPQKLREFPETEGNQEFEIAPEETIIRCEITVYPPSFGRYFTGFNPPNSFVIPNHFWIFFWSDQLGSVIGFEQIRYLQQSFSIPDLTSKIFVQIPSVATVRLELYG